MTAVENVLSGLDVRVVGKAVVASEAISLVEQQRPDLFVAEIATTDGLSSVCDALRRRPGQRVVVLSSSADPDDVAAALQAGVAAYVVKTVEPEDLVSTFRQTFNPSVFLPGSRSVPTPQETSRRAPESYASLTKREAEILRLVAEGRSNGQVARMLWVTEQTVKFHLSNIYRKLDVGNRTQASRWAQMRGLLEPGT
jgi:DNA-binding NarL/FixJ family response regulator